MVKYKQFGIIFLLGLLVLGSISSVSAAKVIQHTEAEDINHVSWGRTVSEITNSETAYGGILKYGDARMVTDINADNPAYYTFVWQGEMPRTLTIRHLDGMADDSFNVLGISPCHTNV